MDQTNTPVTSPRHSVEDVKSFRKDVDALIQRVENAFSGSRELSLVKTKLEEAKMWAGKEIGNIAQEIPAQYADKAPTADAAYDAPAEPEATDRNDELAPNTPSAQHIEVTTPADEPVPAQPATPAQ